MNELKSYEGDCILDEEVYLKSDVDKLIADLEESHKKEVGRLRAELEYSTYKCDYAKVIAEKDAKILALDAEVAKQKHHAELYLDERNYAEEQLRHYKSEADKVIARHHKYKRCLAMAQWCMDAECKTEKDADFLVRWEHLWLSLAEEPTWAKFLQLIHKEAK